MKHLLLYLFSTISIIGFSQWENINSSPAIEADSILSFQLINDNQAIVITNESKVYTTNLEYSYEGIQWTVQDIPLDENEKINKYGFASFFKDTTEGIILTEANGKQQLKRRTGDNWATVSISPEMETQSISKIYEFDNNRIMATVSNTIYYTDDFGINWSSIQYPKETPASPYTTLEYYKFYPQGIGFIRMYDKIFLTDDYGTTWKEIHAELTRDNTIEFFCFDNTIYYGKSESPYILFSQQFFMYDILNKTSTAISPLLDYSDCSTILLSPSDVYKFNYRFYTDNTLNISKLYNNKFYEVTKDSILMNEASLWYSNHLKSYANDGNSYALFTGNKLLKNSPKICEDILFTSLSNENDDNVNINYTNNTGGFLNYTGGLISTYTNDTLVEKVKFQLHGNFEGETSIYTHETFPLSPNTDYGVVIDYDLGEKSCFFGYNNGLVAGIKNGLDTQASVFPSIATETIQVISIKGIESISFFDLKGNQMLTTREQSIDVSALKKGKYLVTINHKNGMVEKHAFIKL